VAVLPALAERLVQNDHGGPGRRPVWRQKAAIDRTLGGLAQGVEKGRIARGNGDPIADAAAADQRKRDRKRSRPRRRLERPMDAIRPAR